MCSQSIAVKLALTAALLPLSFRAAQKPLTHIDDVRRMSLSEAAKALPVRITGTVTALSGWKNSFFLQDVNGGVSVDRSDSIEVHTGDRVEVTGTTGAGMFAPILQTGEVHILRSHMDLPLARRARFGDMAGGKLDSQRTEIRGVVHSATIKSSWGRDVLFLEIDVDGQVITTRVREFPQRNFSYLVDATVTVRGVSGTIFNEKRQFLGVRLFVPALQDITVEKMGAADPFSLPETPLSNLLQFDPTREVSHRVHVSGVLTAERAGRILYLQEGAQSVVIRTEQPFHPAIGSRLEAAGFTRASEFAPALFEASVRVVGKAILPSFIRVNAAKVIDSKDGFAFTPANGLQVQTEGEVIEQVNRQGEQVWFLRDGNTVFEAHLQTAAGSRKYADIPDGSWVRVTGVCVVTAGQSTEPQSFQVLLRSPDDLAIVRAPIITSARLIWFALGLVLLSGCVLILAFRVKRAATGKLPDGGAAPLARRDFCHRAARWAGLINAAVGAAALGGGWILNIALFRFIAVEGSVMRPMTALGLLSGGLALYFDREDHSTPIRKATVYLCAGMSALTGLLPLIEYCFALNFRFYELLQSRNLIVSYPGRMSFVTALSLTAIGFGILLSRSRSGFGVGQGLAILAGALALFNAIGHLFGIRGLFGLALSNPIFDATTNIYTALGIALLSAGAIFSRPTWGLMIPVIGDGMGGIMARRLLPCALIIPVGMGWIRLQGQTHGLYDGTFGLTLFASSNIAVFMFLIWKSANRLNQSDAERSNTERNLRRSEKNFRSLADAMPQIVWTTTADGNPDYFNRRWYDYTGVSLKQTENWGWMKAFHPGDLAETTDRWMEAVRTGGPYEIEYRIKCIGDGTYRWHLGRGIPMLDEKGKVVRWFGTCTDIEDSKAAQTSVRELNETLEERVRQRTAALAKANRELADTRANLQGVLDAATQISIIATDAEGVIRIFNTGAQRMLQYSAKEIEGVCTPAILHVPAESEKRAVELTRELGRPVEGFEVFVSLARLDIGVPREWTYVRKDGSTLDVNLAVTAVRGASGVIQGFLGIATDITARKCMERDLQLNNERLSEQTRRAEDASRTKSDFLATMSHEIRTPLNAILGMADLLSESELNSEQAQYVEVFRRAGGNLLTQINEILDLSKIEAGQMELEQIGFDLEEVVRSAVELLTAKARGKGLALMSRIAPGVELSLVGDAARLRQILINLLGNAVKFTDSGQVLLSVESPDAANIGFIKFSIVDTGIGIPLEKQERIFEDFTQVDASITRRFGGTGLGLGISRRLVEQMGGEIGVASSPEGSTFHFSLTFQIGSSDRDKYGDLEDLHGLRVLILDDNATNRLILRETLSGWGLESTDFERPRDALSHLAENRGLYSLAILDSIMPGMNGFEAAARIRETAPGLPVLMLSSDNRPGELGKSRQAGLAGYAVKPVNRTDLFRLVCDALKRDVPAGVSRYHVALTEPVSPQRPLEILVAEDSPDNRLLVRAYLKGTPHGLTFAEDGLEAVHCFKAASFDLVLMDIRMPLMDGLSAIRAIRQTEFEKRAAPVPILALSANARAEDVAESCAAGATGHLSKPISKSQLLLAIGLHSSRISAPSAEKIWVDAPEGLEEIVPGYLLAQRNEVQKAFKLLAESDFERLSITGHNMKGTGKSYGFIEISSIGSALEASARDRDHGESNFHLQALNDYLARVEVRSDSAN